MDEGNIIAEEKSSLLGDIVKGIESKTGGLITGGLLKTVGKSIFSGLKSARIKAVLKEILDELKQIEQTQVAIINEIKYIDTDIKKAIDGSQIKDAQAEIKGKFNSMMSLLEDLNEGKYDEDSDTLQSNYQTIIAGIEDVVPGQANQISEFASDFMNQLLTENREQKLELLNYNLYIFYALRQLDLSYRAAISALEFAQPQYIYLDNIIEDVEAYITDLFDWQKSNMLGALTPIVSGLLNGATSCTISVKVACYGDDSVTETGDDNGSYWMGPYVYSDSIKKVVTIPMSEPDAVDFLVNRYDLQFQKIVVVKVDDFDLQNNPSFNLHFENDKSELFGVGTEIYQSDCIHYGNDKYSDSETWQFLCCESSAIDSSALKDYFCLYNVNQKNFAMVDLHTHDVSVQNFDKSNAQQFWTFKS